jgi:signal transduction histidine kinase
MLYVSAGLAVMFGALALIGLGAIDQATQLVFKERLATAYTTAGIMDRDFARAASDANEALRELDPADRASASATAAALLAHLDQDAPFLFFRASGVWVLDAEGHLAGAAGAPGEGTTTAAQPGLVPPPGSDFVVRVATGSVPGATAFGLIALRLGAPTAGASFAIIHLVSINSTSDYEPASYGAPSGVSPTSPPEAAPDPSTSDTTETGYHLEVVDPNGIAVLGIGADERPGEPSRHFDKIKALVAKGEAAAMLHESDGTFAMEPHVMAVVPLPNSPFYVVLEQPVDIALALPHDLQSRLLIATTLGFAAALVVAWITTRHVVKPTEELTTAAGRMAEGDLTSPIDVRADDEVGRLAESLEEMRRQLAVARQAADETRADLERRVAERTARIDTLLGQTIDAQEDERRRLARELHDETAQTLAALSITLDRARDELSASSPEARAHIGDARATAARLLAETRRLILGLRPAVLDDLGLLPAIRWYAETAFAGSGVQVSVESSEDASRLPAYLEVALFRIAQEAISNAAKHAQARQVIIRLALDAERATLTVSDDGIGFDVDGLGEDRPSDTARVGLIGMQERVRLIAGKVIIQSSPSGGTTIVVTVPVAGEAV